MNIKTLGEKLGAYIALGEEIYGKGYYQRNLAVQEELALLLGVNGDESINDAIRRVCAHVSKLEAEIDRLKDCAQQQAQGTNGCKTIRVELIPKGKRVACCVTFPSAFPDGEKAAAETAASMLSLLCETANGLSQAQSSGSIELEQERCHRALCDYLEIHEIDHLEGPELDATVRRVLEA